MSDPSNDPSTPAAASPDGSSEPDIKALSHVESPAIAPGDAETTTPEVANTHAASHEPAQGASPPEPQHPETVAALPRGTALILAPARLKAERPGPEPEPAAPKPARSPRRFGLGSVAAMVTAAAAIGGLAGSLATAGVSYWPSQATTVPSYYSALAEALGRVDHELTALKGGVESSGKATGAQVAKFADRMDRVERAQADTGAKLTKATDAVDRMERRLATTSNDVTGAIGETRVAAATTLAPGPGMGGSGMPGATGTQGPGTQGPGMKTLLPGPIIEGWVVRDVYNGSAMIQSRAGIVQVIPGDSLPGLGRIEQVRRQDGHWMVVTSRGVIVSR
jgi:hypothetical protein